MRHPEFIMFPQFSETEKESKYRVLVSLDQAFRCRRQNALSGDDTPMLISSFYTNNTCRKTIAVGAFILGHQIRAGLTGKHKQRNYLLTRKVGLNGNKGNRGTRETGDMSICFDKEIVM